MAEPKTVPTGASVEAFIAAIPDESRREDCTALVKLTRGVTRAQPRMWGPSIVGFGDHDYFGASGKPTSWFEIGFSPRKAALSLYLMGGKDAKLLAKLGPSSMGAGCLYIERLDDVHQPTLQKLIDTSVKRLRALAPTKTGRD